MDDLGELTKVDDRWQLRFVRWLAHPPEKVWAAVTEPDHLRVWFPFDIEGERAAGAPLRFLFREDEAPDFDGEMVEFDPPRVMELKWEGDERVRLEVAPDGEGTQLTLLNRFDELGKAARDGTGWHVCLELLIDHLEDRDTGWDTVARHRELNPKYVERLGPEAASVGIPEDWNVEG
jgi:uncharacterized protein YndB with AHSA1/START domain